MQLTISSDEPRDRVIEAVGALFGVRLAVVSETTAQDVDPGDGDALEEDERVTKTRH